MASTKLNMKFSWFNSAVYIFKFKWSATSLAYDSSEYFFESTFVKNMEISGWCFAAIAVTRLESSPPEQTTPTPTSEAIILSSTLLLSISFSFKRELAKS